MVNIVYWTENWLLVLLTSFTFGKFTTFNLPKNNLWRCTRCVQYIYYCAFHLSCVFYSFCTYQLMRQDDLGNFFKDIWPIFGEISLSSVCSTRRLLGVVYNWPESPPEWRPVAAVRLSASCSTSNHPTSTPTPTSTSTKFTNMYEVCLRPVSVSGQGK